MNKLIHGNSLEKLKELEDNSIDAVVCDPPYELGFMGKKWDNTGIAYSVDLWTECLRVLKPGGHLLAFSGTRTYHRMAVAIEDAGFEVRDMLEWVYASGFPKSLNVGKAVDKLQGNEREEYLSPIAYADSNCWGVPNKNSVGNNWGVVGADNSGKGKGIGIKGMTPRTKGNSKWEGFGTALKPAHEPIVMARKPLECKTIVENVLKHGTGAIDIDGCRIPLNGGKKMGGGCKGTDNPVNYNFGVPFKEDNTIGRFPANIICTDDALNDGVMTKSNAIKPYTTTHNPDSTVASFSRGMSNFRDYNSDANSGSKSRYFDLDVWAEKHGLLQFPKASKRERNEGCEGLEKKAGGSNAKGYTEDVARGLDRNRPVANHHPTVKPVHLMSWLIRLVSKEGDVVLDPFMGSGTTGVACKKLNRQFIGIEMTEEYIPIAEARIKAVKNTLL